MRFPWAERGYAAGEELDNELHSSVEYKLDVRE